MKADQVEKKLIELKACVEARKWAKGKSMNQIWKTCHRGDWMLWLWARIYPDDLKTLTLAKGYCAKTVLHLMTDQRSKDAVKAAIAFGRGRLSREKLDAAAYAADAYVAYAYATANAAYAAYAATYAAADAAAAAYAAYAAAYAAADAAAAYAAYAAAAYAAYAATDALYVYDAARIKNQKATADICRKYLKTPKWKI